MLLPSSRNTLSVGALQKGVAGRRIVNGAAVAIDRCRLLRVATNGFNGPPPGAEITCSSGREAVVMPETYVRLVSNQLLFPCRATIPITLPTRTA
jgi:hypothetical protein